MNELEPIRYELTRKDSAKNKLLKYGAWLAPVTLSIVPAAIFFALSLLATGATTAMFFFFSVIALLVGLVFGLLVTGGIFFIVRAGWQRYANGSPLTALKPMKSSGLDTN